MIYKLCNLDFCAASSFGENFGGGIEPCVLMYARKQSEMIRNISQFTRPSDFIIKDENDDDKENILKGEKESNSPGNSDIDNYEIITVH